MVINVQLTDECRKGFNTKRFIVVHDTDSKPATTLPGLLSFLQRKDYISVHYVIGYDGSVTQMIAEDDRAFHAGVSEWKGVTNLNDHSIGIEVLFNGNPFTNAQRETTVELVKNIMARNKIASENVLRHADIAIPKGRRSDVRESFFVPVWGTWAKFQESLATNATPQSAQELLALENAYAEKAGALNAALAALNEVKMRLAKAKGVTFIPLSIAK